MKQVLIHILGMTVMLIAAILPIIPDFIGGSNWWSFFLLIFVSPPILFIGYWMYSQGDMDVFKESKVRIKSMFRKLKP